MTAQRLPYQLGIALPVYLGRHQSIPLRRAHASIWRVEFAVRSPTPSVTVCPHYPGPRTLQRRLSESGHSFQSIVDLARKKLALKLLGETELCLAEIAILTGFSEQSGFTRAFKRWAGQTPRSYRLETSTVRKPGSDATGRYSGGSEQERTADHSNQLT